MAHNSTAFHNPLTLDLDLVGPKPTPTRGEPVESVKVLFEDAFIEAGVWECTRHVPVQARGLPRGRHDHQGLGRTPRRGR